MIIEEILLLLLILLFLWLEFSWELYLSLRQRKIYETKNTIPEDLKDFLNEESFTKARLYGLDKNQYNLGKDLLNIVLITNILIFRWMYTAWQQSENIAALFNIGSDQEILTRYIFISFLHRTKLKLCLPHHKEVYTFLSRTVSETSYKVFTPGNAVNVLISCVFMTYVTLFNFVIYMPLTVYHTFVLEEKHGFNKQTIGFFIKDQFKSLVLSLVITLPIVSILIYIIMLGGKMFVIWLWLFTTVTTLILLTLYPTVIAPLFDKFVPLPDGDLRKGIENLASRLQFPLSQVYIVEGSKRSAHSNAYFTGLFGAKRIVLFDTLLEKYDETKKKTTGCTNNEILGVLAHELGHWSCSHIYKSIALTEVNLLLLFTAFGLLFKYSLLYTSLGFPAGQEPVVIGLIAVMQFILAPYNSLLSYFTTALSRKFEFEADNFALSLNYPMELKSALIKLGKDNLDYPIYDKLYSAWYHSHPTLLQRIENIKTQTAIKKDD